MKIHCTLDKHCCEIKIPHHIPELIQPHVMTMPIGDKPTKFSFPACLHIFSSNWHKNFHEAKNKLPRLTKLMATLKISLSRTISFPFLLIFMYICQFINSTNPSTGARSIVGSRENLIFLHFTHLSGQK